MRISNTLSNVMIKCGIIAHVASWSVPDDKQDSPLHSKGQNTPIYSWEQSWRTESNDHVTTVTTSTSGIIPPGIGFNQGAACTWSYKYSYSNSFTDTESNAKSSNDNYAAPFAASISNSSEAVPSNQSSVTTPINSYPKAPNVSKSPEVVHSSPKPVQQTNASIPIQQHSKAKPGYTNTKTGQSNSLLGFSETQPGHISTRPVYQESKQRHTSTNPLYNNTAINSNGDNLGLLSNTKALSGTSKQGITPDEVQAWLDLHNNYRAQYGVGSVTWSDELVPVAQYRVDRCMWKHTKNNQYGENIAAGQKTASDVVVAWVEGPNERDIWSPQSAIPTHFTQVVWKATMHIGCAQRRCRSIEGSNLPQSPVILWACEYSPKGNVRGEYEENVLAATGGKPLSSASSSASVFVDPYNPNAAKARGRSATVSI